MKWRLGGGENKCVKQYDAGLAAASANNRAGGVIALGVYVGIWRHRRSNIIGLLSSLSANVGGGVMAALSAQW